MKKKIYIVIFVMIGILAMYIFYSTHFYGKDSRVNLYQSLEEYKTAEHIDFYDFYDPLEYIVNDKKIHISEYQDLLISTPIRFRDFYCTFHIVHEENENNPTAQFTRKGTSLSEVSKNWEKKIIENITVYYSDNQREDEEIPAYYFIFQLDGIVYSIIVEDEHHMFSREEMFHKMFDYFEMQFKEV